MYENFEEVLQRANVELSRDPISGRVINVDSFAVEITDKPAHIAKGFSYFKRQQVSEMDPGEGVVMASGSDGSFFTK